MAFNKTKSLAQADKYIAKQNFNKALNELLKVHKVSPNDINLINKIGDLYSKSGKNGSAITYFLKVAESYEGGGFNLKAIAVYKKILRLDNTYMDARDRLVTLYLQQGHDSEAKGELRRMAEHYYAENLHSRALACYEKMVEVDPSNLDARIKITEMLVRDGKRAEATEHFVAMGQELLHKKMVHEAQKIIGQGLKVTPQHPDLLVLLAQAYLAMGKTDDALRQLTDICSKYEDNLNAIKILGQTYLERGQLKDAATCFLRALHISEDETAALEDVAQRFIEKGELDLAYNTLVPVSEIFVARGEFEEATRLFRSILYAEENHIPSQEILVHIYEQSQQNANAILALEKMINFYLANHDLDKAREKIEKLLEFDPNHLEWRSKLEALTGEPVEIAASDSTDIHVIDEKGMDLPSNDVPEEELNDLDASPEMNLEPDDPSTKIANHLTEAEVFLKYGMVEKAAGHLMKVKELDFLNVEANTKLKGIFLERNDIDNAVGCMVSLVNACIDRKELHQASEFIQEIAEYRPEIAQMHQDRLKTLMEAEPEAFVGGNPDLGFDFHEDEPPEPTSNFMFEGADQEIVDFRQLPEEEPSFEVPALDGATGEDGWSLDMPQAPQPTAESGQAEDLKDLYGFDLDESGAIQSLDFEPVPTSTPEPGEGEEAEAAQSKPSVEAEAPEAVPAAETDEEVPVPEQEEVSAQAEAPPATAPDTPATGTEAVKHAPLGSAQGSLAGELEEIDFFISVEAYEDAKNLISEAIERFGEHPLILERQQEVEAKTQEAAAAPVGFPNQETDPGPLAAEEGELFNLESGTGFFDLAAELNEELFEEELRDVNDNTLQEEIQSVEELFQEFKKGVEEQIDESDHQTHYDLGIAYKEMGLLEEAVVEFEKARRDRGRFLECNTMIGNCLIELGRTEDTISHYEEALRDNDLNQQEQVALLYELALAYQGLGELEKALQSFQQIQKIEPDYRDLEERIEALV